MKLENQVCNLELSKRLKELGVKQESYFYWCQQKDETFFLPMTNVTLNSYDGGFVKLFSAFTVAELGILIEPCQEMLLPQFHSKKHYWYSPGYESTEADTEADARAKMLIYLLENKLI